MTNHGICFDGVSFKYPGGRPFVLSNLSIGFPRGQRTVLVGPNGAGKSTFLMHMNGILRPVSGKLSFNGQPFIYNRQGLLEIRQKVGVVFQDSDTQLFAPTIEEDISFGPMNLRLPVAEVRHRVDAAMEMCKISHLAKMPVHNLSGGEKKRVALAGVLSMQPEILVLDEPTAGLDPEGISALFRSLDALVEGGVTVVYSTHDMDLAIAWSDLCVVLKQGRIIRSGSPVDVFQDEALMHEASLKTPSVITLTKSLALAGIFIPAQPKTLEELARTINRQEGNLQ